jgi:hypothetical protein
MLISGRRLAAIAVAAASFVVVPAAGADPEFYDGAIFGIANAPGGALYVADTAQGIVDAESGEVIGSLTGMQDIAPIGRGNSLAVGHHEVEGGVQTGVFRISRGNARFVADTAAFEATVDPAQDGTVEGSNPFDLARLHGGKTLVADAAGNSLLHVDEQGRIEWVATFPARTDVACPDWFCEGIVPFPVHSVPTAVAIGPDGAYYVGELTGFPFTPGFSRIWRIEPGTRGVVCPSSPACTLVVDGLTAIIDLQFGPDGRLFVAQLDDAGAGAFEVPEAGIAPEGGSVHACDVATGDCDEIVAGAFMLTAIAFHEGALWGAILALTPDADVVPLG